MHSGSHSCIHAFLHSCIHAIICAFINTRGRIVGLMGLVSPSFSFLSFLSTYLYPCPGRPTKYTPDCLNVYLDIRQKVQWSEKNFPLCLLLDTLFDESESAKTSQFSIIDLYTHLYKRVCPSIGQSIGP